MDGRHGLGDAFVAVFFVEGDGDAQAGVGFEVEFFVASCFCAALDGCHELVAVAAAFHCVIKIELLQLSAIFYAGKFCVADAADDGAIFIGSDIIAATLGLGVIEIAQMIELWIKIRRAGNIQMCGAQIVANDGGDRRVVVSGDRADDKFSLIVYGDPLLLVCLLL